MKILLKFIKDLLLTLYDDTEFQAMSLPRLVFFLMSVAVLVSWVGEQFFGFKFPYFDDMITMNVAAGGWYAAKKWVDKK